MFLGLYCSRAAGAALVFYEMVRSGSELVETSFDSGLNAYIIRMPPYVTFDQLAEWGRELRKRVDERPGQATFALLLDTNQHNFESVACLQYLRDTLSSLTAVGLSKVAFVQPMRYGIPEVASAEEAYFSDFAKARSWLS